MSALLKSLPALIFVLFPTVFVFPTVFAQTYEGRKITGIRIVPPDILDPADRAATQIVKVGDTLRAADVAEQIDRLFATGEFDDIRADVEVTETGVNLVFITVPVRYLGAVLVRGKQADPPNRGELAKVPQLVPGNVFHDEDVSAATQSMQQLLMSNGLYEAKMEPEVSQDSTGRQVFLKFTLKPGKRARYEQPVIKGDAKLSDATVIRATGWRIRFINRWRTASEARTRNGLQGISKKYQNDGRLKAKVELDDMRYDAARRRVQPSLALNAGPKVKVTAIEAKVSQRILERYVPVFQERAVDNDLLAEGARNLRDYFQSKGYFETVVDFRTLPPQDDLERIEYAISQGPRYKLVKVELSGNRYFKQDTLRERMFLEPASFIVRRGRYSEAFRKKDEQNISALYRSNGFRDVKVTSTTTPDYGGKAGQLAVAFRIDEGDQWLVDNVAVEGLAEQEKDAIVGNLASIKGQPFSEVNLAADRTYLLDYYSEHGYPTADVQAAWRMTGPQRANVLYTVRPGPQQFVRDVVITGLTQSRLQLVQERIGLTPGDVLSENARQNSQRRLYDMGIFARVDSAIENPEGATSRKTVLFAIEEANRYTVSLGIGAQVGRFGAPSNSDLSSAGGSTGFSPLVSLNVSRLNFLGRGHTVSARGVYSSLQKRGSLSYFAPRFQNIDGRSFTATVLYDQTRDIRTFSSRREEASVQVSQRFSRSTTGLFRLSFRRVSVQDVIIPVLLVPQLLQTVRLGVISANLARDRRDDSGDAHRGSYTTLDLGISTKYLGSQRSFGRALIRNATYHRVTKDITLARQTQFGVIAPFAAPAGISDQESVPLPERFFGGGAESLRAFPYNQAGPRDTGAPLSAGGPSSQATGFPLGGNALVFNNTELRFPLLGRNIQGVLFHDIGNVYSTLGDVSFRFSQKDNKDFNYAVNAAGMGVRYRTPIGPIRGDLAYTLNPPRYLGFGGTATELLQCGSSGSSSPGCQSTPQRISHFQFFFSIGQTF